MTTYVKQEAFDKQTEANAAYMNHIQNGLANMSQELTNLQAGMGNLEELVTELVAEVKGTSGGGGTEPAEKTKEVTEKEKEVKASGAPFIVPNSGITPIEMRIGSKRFIVKGVVIYGVTDRIAYGFGETIAEKLHEHRTEICKLIKECGGNTIKLRVLAYEFENLEHHASKVAMVKEVEDWVVAAKAQELTVIVSSYDAQSNPTYSGANLVNIGTYMQPMWKAIMEALGNTNASVIYELFNAPHGVEWSQLRPIIEQEQRYFREALGWKNIIMADGINEGNIGMAQGTREYTTAIESTQLANATEAEFVNNTFTGIEARWEMKWAPMSGNKAPAEAIAAWAKTHGKSLRLHNALWHKEFPKSIEAFKANKAEMTKLVEARVEELVKLGIGIRRTCVDIINEPFDDSGAANIRAWPATEAFGVTEAGLLELLEVACKTARRVNPECKIGINEYGVGCDYVNAPKQEKLKNFAVKLKEKGLLDFVGMEMHPSALWNVSKATFEKVVGEYEAHGIEVMLTEIALNEGTGAMWTRMCESSKKNVPWMNIWGPTDADWDEGETKHAEPYTREREAKPEFVTPLKAWLEEVSGTGEGWSESNMSGVEEFDAKLAGMLGKHQIAWNKVDKASVYPTKEGHQMLMGSQDEAAEEVTIASEHGEAFQFETGPAGKSEKVFFQTGATANTATSAVAAIFKDEGGKPGALVGEGTVASAKLTVNSLVEVTAVTGTLAASTKYHILLLAVGGTLHIKRQAAGAGISHTTKSVGKKASEITEWNAEEKHGPAYVYAYGSGSFPVFEKEAWQRQAFGPNGNSIKHMVIGEILNSTGTLATVGEEWSQKITQEMALYPSGHPEFGGTVGGLWGWTVNDPNKITTKLSNFLTFTKPWGLDIKLLLEGKLPVEEKQKGGTEGIPAMIVGVNGGVGWGNPAAEACVANHLSSCRVSMEPEFEWELAASIPLGFKNPTCIIGNVGDGEKLSAVNLASWLTRAVAEVKKVVEQYEAHPASFSSGKPLCEVGNEMYLKGPAFPAYQQKEPQRYGEMFVELDKALTTAGLRNKVRLLFNAFGDYEKTEKGEWSQVNSGKGWIGDALTAQPTLKTKVDGFVDHPYGPPKQNSGNSYGPGAAVVLHEQTVTKGFENTIFYFTEFGIELPGSTAGAGPIAKTEAEAIEWVRTLYKEWQSFGWVGGVWWYITHDIGANSEEKWGLFKARSGAGAAELRPIGTTVASFA